MFLTERVELLGTAGALLRGLTESGLHRRTSSVAGGEIDSEAFENMQNELIQPVE